MSKIRKALAREENGLWTLRERIELSRLATKTMDEAEREALLAKYQRVTALAKAEESYFERYGKTAMLSTLGLA